METIKHFFIMSLLVTGLLAIAALAKPASVLLQEGLYAEEVEGDLDTAIKNYEQIIVDPSAQRSHVAQAMYRQGMCYMKKKNEQQAKAIFEKLVTEYSDQTEIVDNVKPLLEDLSNADPAALMPPETLVYVELGSPGRQIETILNMLKGTPFENPLAVIPGPKGPVGPGDKSPGNIVAALLNPGMTAEFKKIKGLGVGITGITHNNPPAIVVLYPGRSDALRGIILAGLGVVGKPMDSIEGMQAVAFPGGGGAVYDDTVIIAASPTPNAIAQLKWCAKQHKGIMKEPTLASSNKSFAKLSKKARHENALTIWANVNKVYPELIKQFPDQKVSREFQIVDGIADFNSIEDLIAYLAIEEMGIVVETNITFKDGHNCLAYNLFRTPNLTRGGFEAVPSDAVALVSQAFGEPDGVQAGALRQKIQQVTGLDIGREIYANIEQLTLFVVPPDTTFQGEVTFFPGCIGVAITSHNPQQTRQILSTLLGAFSLLTGDQQTSQNDASAGRYQIGIADGQKLYCYMDQINKTTVLSLNRAITDACITAIKERNSVCEAGPLKDAVNRLSPTVSKLVLVNVGGALRLASPTITGPFKDIQRENLERALSQLAQASNQTTIEFFTDEQPNVFRMHTGIDKLPPINQVFGPIGEIAQIMEQAKGWAKAERKRARRSAVIKAATRPPVIDGTAEDLWSDATKYKLENVIYSPISSDEDFSAYFKAMWDEENLYLLVDVTDDILKNDSVEFYYDDTVEVFIDADNSKESGYGENDYTYNFNWDRTSPSMEERGQPYQNDDIKFALATFANGYKLEIKFPWSTLGTKPAAGVKIGLDVHVNDDDDGGDRETKLTWRDREDDAWQNPKVFGTAELAGLVGWWKFDETVGSNADDSSGNGHTGTLMGNPRWQPTGGIVGGAIEFDGVDDYVEIEDESSFNITGQITLSTWVKTNDAGNGEHNPYVTKGDQSYAIKHHENNSIEFFIYDDGWYAVQSPVDSSFNGKWHHLAGTYDGIQIKLYIDGVLQGTTDHTGTINIDDFAVNIGRNSEHTDRFYTGLIDDVRIYNYTLSENEIKTLYSEGRQK